MIFSLMGKPLARLLMAALCILASVKAADADEAQWYDGAKREGQVTWYITHYSGELAQEAGRAFTARYPGVTVNVVRTTAQVAFARLSQDIKAGIANCDVFSSTDIGHYFDLKKRGMLADFTPDNARGLAPQFDRFIDPGLYYPTAAGLVLISYNTKLVPPDHIPKNWPDFLDPMWKGRVTFGHPGFSGYVGVWALEMRKLYGPGFFEKLAANKPLIGRSVNDSVTMLNSGESAIAAGADNTTIESALKGNPLAVVYPTDGAILMVSPSAVMKNAPHPNAARLFMEYVLSADYNRVMVKASALSMRADVAPPAGLKPLSEIKLIRPTDEELVSGIPALIEEWRDVFGN